MQTSLDDLMMLRVDWSGWGTTLTDLKNAGWIIWMRKPNRNWKHLANTKVYILNTQHQQLGRLSFYKTPSDAFTLDFMMPVKQYTGKVKRMFEALNEDDIEWLQEAILEIQSQRPKKSKKLRSNVLPYDNKEDNQRASTHG